MIRRPALACALAFALTGVLTLCESAHSADPAGVKRYVRFQAGETVSYGLVDGDSIKQLSGDLFDSPQETGATFARKDVKILAPTRPTQILAMAGNYKSHLGDKEQDPRFLIPQAFFKSPSCLVPHEGTIVIPKDATDVHYEAEMVVVIGKEARKVKPESVGDYIFGVTCGNDVSARAWQKGDVQWWRAKGSDTFGPCGPEIVTGLDYNNLNMKLRLNGEIKQEERSKMLLHDVAATVSHISQHITLHPGDLIFMGTPGKTAALSPGDVVEVEIEGVGILRNTVAAEE